MAFNNWKLVVSQIKAIAYLSTILASTYIYEGLAVAAMLISQGTTPIDDLYLFIALVALVEVKRVGGQKVRTQAGHG